MEKYLETLKESALFAGIQDADIESMLGCLGARKLKRRKGEYILMAGETAQSIGILLEGNAYKLHESFWGNRNIVAKLGPGHLFAESFACSPGSVLSVSIVADTPVTFMLLNVQRVLTTCSSGCAFHTQVIRNLVSVIAEKNMAFNEKLIHMGQRTTRQKILSYLSAEAVRNKSHFFNIPFDRQQLADYLAVDRSALSNELSKLRQDGALAFQKNHFELLVKTSL